MGFSEFASSDVKTRRILNLYRNSLPPKGVNHCIREVQNAPRPQNLTPGIPVFVGLAPRP